jgi:hypothetical protein
MKNATFQILIATAVIGISAGVASAEDLKAKINFPFEANGKLMQPGSYSVEKISGTHAVYKIGNMHGGAMFNGAAPSTTPAGERPRLVFTCTADGCALTQLWTSTVRYRVPHKATPRDHEAHEVAVLLTHAAD